MAAPKAILFDLGNVLLTIDLSLTYEAFSTYSSLSSSEIASVIMEHQLWVPYEAGKQNDAEFRDFLRERLDLTISDTDFDNSFSALLLDFHAGVYEWIASLKSQFYLILLSNTSSIHAERFTKVALGPEGQNLFSLFDQVYYSFEMGLVKPDTAIYQQVLNEQGFVPEEVLFFDDNVANINSAKSMGIQSYLIDPSRSYNQIQEILDTYVS
ncbi:HAD family hydrolase [Aquirufa lenticrescens]|uniref:HAD family hydrolase n=1 Tax=Aquirufa lenticrescens TaxID=2696560 RepID=UPI001CAA511A|nr:HAD family phosphatase [Aquirufa lenticrescens]UAJ15034.1 HAD family phosphatase [Aquirufa lenticrescens]